MYFHKTPIISMIDLTQHAISVKEKTTVYFPDTDTTAEITGIDKLLKEYEGQRVYCEENGVLAFIANGNLFAIPSSEDRKSFLRNKEDFQEKRFFVPFSDGSQPSFMRESWQEFLAETENPG